jgi:hypothetical protein
MHVTSRIALLAHLCLAPLPLFAQDIARPLEPAPLERPVRLRSFRSLVPTVVLSLIRDSVTKRGFAIVERDDDNLTFAAQHPDAPGRPDYDKLLVWLERDAVAPLTRLHLYLLYGRFEDVWVSSRRGIHRVQVDSDFRDRHIGPILTLLFALPDSI